MIHSHLPSSQRPRRRSLFYHLKSIWLFTFTDLKTIVVPKTLFGVLNVMASHRYDISSDFPISIPRVFLGAFWIWINLLPFVIDNQRRPASILEDEKNKPWRTLPSKRMTPQEARRLVFVLYPIALITSAWIGGLRSAVFLVFLGCWYNNFGGAAGVFTKNFINGYGFICFASGSMEVMLQRSLPSSPLLLLWFAVIGLVVFTTVQLQDIPDQIGDAVAGRQTIPLAVGDFRTRQLTLLAMVAWSFYCPHYWGAAFSLRAIFAGLGLLIGLRCLLMRKVEQDKETFRIWNLWMVLLYATPLITHMQG